MQFFIDLIVAIGAVLGAGAIAVWLFCPNRALQSHVRRLEQRNEELADRNWELKETEERSRSSLEAQGDFIVRRDAGGRIITPTTPFARLPRAAVSSCLEAISPYRCWSRVKALSRPTARIYDQKIATAEGPRWIAWREVSVQLDGGVEIQSVGRDVTDRTEAELALAEARDQTETANRAPSHASSPWSRMKSARR